MAFGVASKPWRDSLLRQVKVPELSQAFDINKYYDFAAKVLLMAEAADLENEHAVAYIKYKQYLGLADNVIIKHNYYKHYVIKRKEFKRQYALVVEQLESLVKRMDERAANNVAELQAAETERLRLIEEEAAKKRKAVLQEQQRQAEAIAARARADAAAAQASERALQAQAHEKELQRLAEIERNMKAPQVLKTTTTIENPQNNTDLLGLETSPTTKSNKVAVYRHIDGREEKVNIVKAHSEGEGGGYTIFIPSLNRERMTETNRLSFLDDNSLVIGLNTQGKVPSSEDLSQEDLSMLSFDRDQQRSDKNTSLNHAYPGVPNPSWMPESSGDAHKVTIPSAQPPPCFTTTEECNNSNSTTVLTGTLLPKETTSNNSNSTAVLTGTLLPKETTSNNSNSTAVLTGTLLPKETTSNNSNSTGVLTGTLLPKETTAMNMTPQPVASAPPAFDSDSFSDALSNDILTAVGTASSSNMSNPFPASSNSFPAPALTTVPKSAPPPSVPVPKPSPAPKSVMKPLDVAPVRPPVAQPPKVAKPYGEEAEEESLADMLAAAATAASRPVHTAATPVPTLVDTSNNNHNASKKKSASSLSMTYNNYGAVFTSRQLKAETERQWQDMLRSGRARIDYLNTYQGIRSGACDSSNGCTVIAPLIGFRHIKWTNPRLPNSHIEHVIDKDCPPILARIRSKFSLPAGSFLMPADVHDYLFDQKLLEESMFGGVSGGNVLEDEHIGSMITSLEECQHKAADQRGEYELVDSLPDPVAGVGVRISCKDSSVLRICLSWYCMKKFSATNLDFIDSSPWDESNAELDPRIFQGHVWHSGN